MRTKTQKQDIIQDLKKNFDQAKGFVFLNLQKLNSPNLFRLKKELRSSDSSLQVSKKTFVHIANPEITLENISGPFALVFDFEGNLKPFSILGKLKDEMTLEVYGGSVEGRHMAADQVWQIAKLPPREIMLSQLVGSLKGRLYATVSTLRAPLQKLHSVVNQIKEKKQ